MLNKLHFKKHGLQSQKPYWTHNIHWRIHQNSWRSKNLKSNLLWWKKKNTHNKNVTNSSKSSMFFLKHGHKRQQLFSMTQSLLLRMGTAWRSWDCSTWMEIFWIDQKTQWDRETARYPALNKLSSQSCFHSRYSMEKDAPKRSVRNES